MPVPPFAIGQHLRLGRFLDDAAIGLAHVVRGPCLVDGLSVLVLVLLPAQVRKLQHLVLATVRARHLDRWPFLLAALVIVLAQQARDLAMARTAIGVGADELLDVLVESCLGVADEVSLVDDEGVGAPGEQVGHEVR